MTTFKWRMIGAAAFILLAFVGLIGYAARVAPQMGRDSKAALDDFYTRCAAHDYAGAHTRLTRTLQNDISVTQLTEEWKKFESRNGPLTKWAPANGVSITGFGGSVCVLPPFVDFRHAVSGAKGTGTIFYVRMVPEDGTWKLQRFNVLR